MDNHDIQVYVRFYDEQNYHEVEIIKYDEEKDLACLKIKGIINCN